MTVIIHCREPYPDMPDIQPHQIRGDIRAKSFDATIPDINNELLQKTFAPKVLDVFFENGGLWYDSGKVIKRAAEGLSIWRESEQIQS
ncbi:MAG: hypothetical protein KZQ81_15265 [Candidatus Thiodiazotropha sp. (ex Rostrolucina anterorostrata)]|nr:hypothetical protein [Candidatus Thiodiazotropha sp. (ex Rostrolucina anterorostrata)]